MMLDPRFSWTAECVSRQWTGRCAGVPSPNSCFVFTVRPVACRGLTRSCHAVHLGGGRDLVIFWGCNLRSPSQRLCQMLTKEQLNAHVAPAQTPWCRERRRLPCERACGFHRTVGFSFYFGAANAVSSVGLFRNAPFIWRARVRFLLFF